MLNIPILDPIATGQNINQIRKSQNYSVPALRDALGLSTTNAIYKWFRGDALPTIDNLVILSGILKVSINDMIITK